MNSPFFMFTFFVPLLVIVGLAALILIVLIKAIAGAFGNRNASRPSAEETKILQDLASSLEKMEKRIENLETIVIDRARKSEFEKL